MNLPLVSTVTRCVHGKTPEALKSKYLRTPQEPTNRYEKARYKYIYAENTRKTLNHAVGSGSLLWGFFSIAADYPLTTQQRCYLFAIGILVIYPLSMMLGLGCAMAMKAGSLFEREIKKAAQKLQHIHVHIPAHLGPPAFELPDRVKARLHENIDKALH